MTEGLLSDRQRAVLRELVGLIADRSRSEDQIKSTFASDAETIDREYRESKQELDARFASESKAADKEHRESIKSIEQLFEREYGRTEHEFKVSIARIAEKSDVNEVATKKALQEAVWLTETVFEATESQPLEQFQNARKGIDGKREELTKIGEAAALTLQQCRQPRSREIPAPNAPDFDTLDAASKALDEQTTEAQTLLDQMRRLFIPSLFRGIWPLSVIVLVALVSIGVAAFLNQWQIEPALKNGSLIGVAAALVVLALLYFVGRAQMARLHRPLLQVIANGMQTGERCFKLAEQRREQQREELIRRRDIDLGKAHQKYEPVLSKIEARREHHLKRINEKYPRLLQDLKTRRENDLYEQTQRNQRRMTELKSNHERDSRNVKQRQEQRTLDNQQRYQRDWTALEKRWHEGTQSCFRQIEEFTARAANLFPGWDDSSWIQWQPPAEFSPVIQFGRIHVDLKKIEGGLPRDERLKLLGPAQFELPAMLAFPDLCSMLLQAGADGRDEAVSVLQTVMFRLLTTLPPGKVRFTIIDPVGLGQNFAGFMHLADYEGSFVAEKIWTEDRHIDQRLLDLTEHMENVIQKYLRNEYETIGDYNVDAGEIAEPFRFLVIANFPVNFSESAARRLASIINSGARCGVYTLITHDTRQPLPPGIQLSDLERNCARLTFDPQARRFTWQDEDYKPHPLKLDPPPREDFVTEKLHIIGKAAKESTRVEVPFDVIAPEPAELWSRSTSSELTVALGRAGATKLQHLTLGVGTSQHALVAGKTGSGKSTLLHALITNLSLWYPPDEVEFYLVDFKKGVEFKTYATHALPHARAVAIESDREFGLSVLQRLDAELKHRGNVYRDLGVQDLAAYRRTDFAKTHPIPRTLLIIDEFQELFTEDDKIGQDAALLLDRLVRQGRAFGMHVLLGSQTLGGAYSLARSTINQMAVRIALQCSEADSYLILSDDNAAARLLSRPGEAIYNDASGMVEGNNPFQIVWLPDEKREECLQRVQSMAQKRHYRAPEPQIVFEGNVPAEIERNHLLSDLLHRATWPAISPGSASSAWLGEAIAIKDPTAATFRRQSGNNLIIVGQREEPALAMLATSLLSLAAQHAPAQSKFYILDGSPVDTPGAGYLARISSLLPHQIHNVSYRDVPAAINEIHEELERRQQGGQSADADTPTIYLFIYGLQRYRMLRQEDDFGMGSFGGDGDAPPRPEKQFGNILREGPHSGGGIHTLAWCDTVNNLNRSLDRQGLKEFEIRVLFQMGASDSSNLIDSPLASRLGLHRALFFSEEQGHLEKFRPYAMPDEQWLMKMSQMLGARQSAASVEGVPSDMR